MTTKTRKRKKQQSNERKEEATKEGIQNKKLIFENKLGTYYVQNFIFLRSHNHF